MRSRYWLGLALLWLSATGCSSLHTTFFRRHDDDTLCKENDVPIHGVPVMVKVPTHLELRVDETIHLIKEPGKTTVQVIGPAGTTLRSVDANLRVTEKMFVLDPKRPMSGTANYGFAFQSKPDGNSNAAKDLARGAAGHGYLQGLKYKVDDQTLANVSTFLANIAPLLATPVARSEDAPADPLKGVYTTRRTIAFGLFDLASPSFEDEVNAFLEEHVNRCSPCYPNSSIHQQVATPAPAE